MILGQLVELLVITRGLLTMIQHCCIASLSVVFLVVFENPVGLEHLSNVLITVHRHRCIELRRMDRVCVVEWDL